MLRRVAIVDLGLGNIGAVVNMLHRAGGTACLVSDPNELDQYSKVMLPGVGSFDSGISKLESAGFRAALHSYASSGRALLGICLGMQLLADGSEEGRMQGLGLVPGTVRRFSVEQDRPIKVPHMGWNQVTCSREHPLTTGLDDSARFYFVHSYYFKCEDKQDELLSTNYGFDFSSGVQRDNVMGVQFHPEKSHRYGMQLIKNFIEL
jgi:imidazole glycerol-phosphate synthase subunit HisH